MYKPHSSWFPCAVLGGRSLIAVGGVQRSTNGGVGRAKRSGTDAHRLQETTTGQSSSGAEAAGGRLSLWVKNDNSKLMKDNSIRKRKVNVHEVEDATAQITVFKKSPYEKGQSLQQQFM